MNRFAAHYIFTGEEVLRKAVVASDQNQVIHAISSDDAMAIEYSNTVFFNGIICPAFISAPETIPSNEKTVTLLKVGEDIEGGMDVDSLYIHFDPNNLTELWAYLEILQQKGFVFFDLLRVLCVNNYKLQGLNPPVIKKGNECPLVLLHKLNLSILGFRATSKLRRL